MRFARRGTRIRKRLRIAAAVSLLCAALPFPAPGQEAAPAPAPAPTTPAPAEKKTPVVATADIGVEVEKAKAGLTKVVESLSPSEAAAEIEREVPDLAKRVSNLLNESSSLRESDPSLPDLDEQSILLGGLVTDLARAQSALRSEMKDLEAKLDQLRAQAKTWAATKTSLVEADASQAVLDLVAEANTAITKAEALAKQRQGTLVELQGRVASLNEAVQAESEKLAKLQSGLVGQVFRADRQPLWSGDIWEGLELSMFRERVRQEADREFALAVAYAKSNRSLIVLHLLVLAALTLAMLAVRRRVARSAITDDGLSQLQKIFDRPISLAVLLVFMLSVWTLPEFPRGLRHSLGLFLLLPAILILRRIVEPAVFPILNALLVFFAIERLQMVLVLLPDVSRILFTLEMIALLAVLLWWSRSNHMQQLHARLGTPFRLQVLAIGTRVGIFASASAIVCGLFGYAALATVIGTNFLFDAYTATILYGAARVLDALAAFLLRVRPLRLLRLVRRNRLTLHAAAVRVINFAAVVWWVQAGLDQLSIADDVWDGLIATLSATAQIGEVSIQVGEVAAFAFTVWASFAISRFVRFVLEEDIYPHLQLAKGMPYAASALVHYSVLLIGFLMAIMALGIDTDRFALLAGAFGVGIGFGLQNIVNNFVSGLILLTERPVEVGDTVTIGDTFGLVQRIGIRSSTVRTWQGAEVIVPNANLVSEEVTNWTHSDTRRRMEIPVGVAYGTDPARVIEILAATARDATDVLSDPEPIVLFMNYGDSSLDFEVRAWTSNFENYLRVKSDLMVQLTATLRENEITIPFPQRDLHVKSLPEQTSAPKDEEEKT